MSNEMANTNTAYHILTRALFGTGMMPFDGPRGAGDGGSLTGGPAKETGRKGAH